MSISVVINTLNEEDDISACLDTVYSLADEIVVCDMHSDDHTVEIARQYGAKVVFHERLSFVEPARHYAISQASHEWILVLDADERMTEKLAGRLRSASLEAEFDIVTCGLRYWCFGDWVTQGGFFEGGWVRFFRKAAYMRTYESSEEHIHHGFHALRNSPNTLGLSREYHIDHYAYPTIEKYVHKTLGTYARIEAEQYFAAGRRFSLFRLILSPIRTFVNCFFFKLGYKDGIRGFILAVLYSIYYFCIWANVWSLENGVENTHLARV